MSCHQEGGIGIPNTNPPLNGKTVTGDKFKLIAILINGSSKHEETVGTTYNNVMPPNRGMDDQGIADVLTYIRNSFGNKASAVKTSEVKTARSKLNKS